MRTMMSSMILGLTLIGPLAAQDTTVVIQNDVCTVKVEGKRLAAKEEKAACDRLRLSAEKVRGELGILRERLFDQSEAFRIQGQALRTEGEAFSKLRATEMPEMTTLLKGQRGALLRLQDEEGKFGNITLTTRPLAALAARPRFGITIDTRPRDTDRYGAYVSGVTPAGPADKAGIQSGDIIVKIGDEVIAKTKGEETPGVRLIAVIGKLEVGKAVSVELRRSTDTKKVKVTPENDDNFFAEKIVSGDREPLTFSFGERFPPDLASSGEFRNRDVKELLAQDPMIRGSYEFSLRGGASGQLGEMATMNPELGTYFGTTDGVLILSTGKNQELGLQGGDVVLSVDGRKVGSPGALTRILRSYVKGDSFKLQVMRQKKTIDLAGKMP